MDEKEAIRKEREVVEGFAKILRKVYGSYWNFEIDFVKGGDVKKNYQLRVKVYKR